MIVIDPNAQAGNDAYCGRPDSLPMLMPADETAPIPGYRRNEPGSSASGDGLTISYALPAQLQTLGAGAPQ